MEDNAEPVFICPCGKNFKRKHPYERHMDVAHSSRECYKCEICKKTFGNHNTLTMHMSVHQETKATFANIKSSERTLRSGKRVKTPLASEPEAGISDEDPAKENLEPNQTAKDRDCVSNTEERSVTPSPREGLQVPATSTAEVFTIAQTKSQPTDASKLTEVVPAKTIAITVKSKPEPELPEPIAEMNQVNGRIVIKTELPEEIPVGSEYSTPEALPMVAQLNGGLPAFDSSDADIDDDDLSEEERNVRKSTRLVGKTPGWKTWLEKEDQWSGTTGDKGNRKRKMSRIKQEVNQLESLAQLSTYTPIPKLEPDELSGIDNPSYPVTKKQGKTGKMVLLCNICGKDFPGEKYLSMHMALHRASGQPENLPQVVMDMEDDPPVKRTKSNNNSQWTCKICDKTFAQNSNYKNHIRTHSDERPFVCDICCIGFKERYHLKKHQLFKHSTELKEECRVCGKRFKDSTAVRAHERIHSDVRPYACRRCGKTFKTSECLWHHENRSKTCGQALWGSSNPPARFKRGRQPNMKKEAKMAEKPKPPAIPTPAPVPTPRPQQRVSLVPVTIPSHGALQIPVTVQDLAKQSTLRVQVDPPPPKPPVDYRPDSPLSNVMRSGIDPPLSVVKVEPEMALPDYELTAMTSDGSLDSSQDSERELDDFDEKDLSPKSMTSGSLSDQGSVKSGSSGSGAKKRYTCEKCSKQFVSSAAFDKHMITHSEARPYKCHLCDIGFKLKVHLKKHNLYRHSDEYPCECSICGKKFKDSSAVRLHERIHSTDRPFKCECGKSFKTRENLWGHRHRGPCEKAVKDGSLLGISPPEDFILPTNGGNANLANVSAHAHITNNQIIAQAMVADNRVTAHATIGDNGELMLATASILGPAISAQANVDGDIITARSKLDQQEVISQYPVYGQVDSAKVPTQIGRVSESRVIQGHCQPVITSQGSVPTARVAPFKRERTPEPAGNNLPLCLSEKSILPPFEASFAPTIRSALARSPMKPPSICTGGEKKGLSIADRCPTIQKCLMQGRPNTTKLPGIQQLFQSHSLAKANKNNPPMPSPCKTPPVNNYVSPAPSPLRTPTLVGTSPSARDLNQLFASLPPPPPYPGNPNLGSPSSLDMPRSPAESTESGGLPIVYWDDELERKANSLQWQTDPDSLFHELSSTGFGSL